MWLRRLNHWHQVECTVHIPTPAVAGEIETAHKFAQWYQREGSRIYVLTIVFKEEDGAKVLAVASVGVVKYIFPL